MNNASIKSQKDNTRIFVYLVQKNSINEKTNYNLGNNTNKDGSGFMEAANLLTRHNEVCPLDVTIKIIDGKWKSIILCRLMTGPLRYSELLRSLSGCNRRTLSLQLTDLINDHVVYKTINATCVPIKTTYHLTKLGYSLVPLIKEMDTWGKMYLNTI